MLILALLEGIIGSVLGSMVSLLGWLELDHWGVLAVISTANDVLGISCVTSRGSASPESTLSKWSPMASLFAGR